MAVTTTTAPALDGIPLEPPERGTFFDKRLYLSQTVYEREMEALLPQSWVLVADLDQLQRPGDYVCETIGFEPVLVVRDGEGQIRALTDVCPHRGSLIVEDGAGNCGKTLVCPYHGWSYRLDGSLRGVASRKDMIGAIDKQAMRLREFRTDVWERFVFVNLSGDAPPLVEYLEAIPDLLRNHEITEQHRGPSCDDVVEANWKIFIDNALDDYHIPIVHAESLQPMHKGMTFREDLGSEWTNILLSPLNEFGMSLYGVPDKLAGETRGASYAIDVFPNLTILAFPDGGVTTMRWTPLDLEHTRVRVQAYSHYGPGEFDPAATERIMQMIQVEDYDIVRKVQRGVRSQYFSPGPCHYLELRTHRFHYKIIELLAASVSG
jgi:nitrite reductase/ring-hydroxylating ferredoxin subunit